MCNSHLGLYSNLDPQKHCIRTALSASPMSISACHLGHFFAILKTQVSEKLGPPLPSVSSHRIGFPVVHFTQFVIYRMALDDDSTQRTRTVRECCGSGWGGDDSMQFRAVQAMFCAKLGAPCSSLQKAAHLKPIYRLSRQLL